MAAKGACQLLKIGELSVTTTHNEPLAAVSIDGHAAQMLVDTGAAKSTLWRPALESLGLHAVGSGARFIGVNGADEADIFTVRDFALGGYVVHLHRAQPGQGLLHAPGRPDIPDPAARARCAGQLSARPTATIASLGL
ncbi:MAG TPA: retropepsin-like aspartic protease [Steroidobacteraceae bacterium]|jgi:hypothetical protein|nr:retropepsin-like aspartic protease [Steroidobacteraceae bacterium]